MAQDQEPSVGGLAASIAGADEARRTPPPPHESRAQRRRRAREAGYWFLPRSWGGGWAAVSWQGYVVSGTAGVLMLLSAVALDRPGALVSMVVILLVTLFVADKKGKPARRPERK